MEQIIHYYRQQIQTLITGGKPDDLFHLASQPLKTSPPPFLWQANMKEISLDDISFNTEQNSSYVSQKLSSLLQEVWGLRCRKISANWIYPNPKTCSTIPLYRRHTISGGGLYPEEIFLCIEGVDHIKNGIYQFRPARGTLQQIRDGRFNQYVTIASNTTNNVSCIYAILTARFERNAFKYSGLAYQIIAQDQGAIIASFHDIGNVIGLPCQTTVAFDDKIIDQLIGLEDPNEASFAILKIGENYLSNIFPDTLTTKKPFSAPPVTPQRHQQSELSRSLTLMRSLHIASRSDNWKTRGINIQQNEKKQKHHLSPIVPYKAHQYIKMDRKSSYGYMNPNKSISFETITNILRESLLGYDALSTIDHNRPTLIYLQAALLRISDRPRGVYEIDGPNQNLTYCHELTEDPLTLSSLSFVHNTSVSHACAIICIMVKTEIADSYWGSRSLRAANAEVGIVAQRLYQSFNIRGLIGNVALGYLGNKNDLIFMKRQKNDQVQLMFFGGFPLKNQNSFKINIQTNKYSD